MGTCLPAFSLPSLPFCNPLQRLRLAGGAAASLKFMPVLPHARASLQWLWSVVRLQGMHNCLGLRCARAAPCIAQQQVQRRWPCSLLRPFVLPQSEH